MKFGMIRAGILPRWSPHAVWMLDMFAAQMLTGLEEHRMGSHTETPGNSENAGPMETPVPVRFDAPLELKHVFTATVRGLN